MHIQPENENFILTELSIGSYLIIYHLCYGFVLTGYSAHLTCRQDFVFEGNDRL